ncbi:hypothetical protein Q2941_26045 [Bradyrhizobium sp. UFLA05-153]
MKKIFLLVLLSLLPSGALSQTAPPSETQSFRDQIKADRARAAAEEKSADPARPWDRDAHGRRFWDRESEPPEGEISIREQIKAARAKDAAEQTEAGSSRQWYKDEISKRERPPEQSK